MHIQNKAALRCAMVEKEDEKRKKIIVRIINVVFNTKTVIVS